MASAPCASLHSMKGNVPGHVVEVHRLENVADRALNEAMGGFFTRTTPSGS